MENFELSMDKETIFKIIGESIKGGKLKYPDDTELCYYKKDSCAYSIYLAVYDNELCWTISKHEENEEDYTNLLYTDFIYPYKKVDQEHLYTLCELVLSYGVEWLENEHNVDDDFVKYANTKTWESLDVYEETYDYDDLVIGIAIADYLASQKDSNWKKKLEDIEDMARLIPQIKRQWNIEKETLSYEEIGYMGTYTFKYLKERE